MSKPDVSKLDVSKPDVSKPDVSELDIETTQQPPLSPMLRGLLADTPQTPTPAREPRKPPQTAEEAKAQIREMMEKHAVEMDVLAKL
ncbi:MAG: hypothetical protein AAF708_02350 [Deinococcota bacterium]